MALEDYKAETERCSVCSYCEWIPLDQIKSWRFAKGCPSIAYSNLLSYSARGRYAVARSLLEGRCGVTDRVLDIVYKCQACGACDVACKVCRYNLEPLEMILELKARMVEDGKRLPRHELLMEHLRKERNTLQKPAKERGRWAEGLRVKRLSSEKAEVLFHAGCRLSFDEALQGIARTAVSLLVNAGVDLGIMDAAETCCGSRAWAMGYREEFREAAGSTLALWKKAGIRRVVTSCAHCYHGFKRLYPKAGSDFEVLHTVEFLDRLIGEGRIRFAREIPTTVTYHDPCHLGRQGEPYVPWSGVEKKIRNQIIVHEPRRPRYNGAWGVYDPPRRVLERIPGLRLAEMERIREYAWCCGAGGGVREAYPEFARWTAAERLEEAKSAGADAIVTACPWCEKNLSDALDPRTEKIRVIDIAQLVQQAM